MTIRSLGRHHRCLNTESVSLAFMDEDVSLYLEREMATALQKPGSNPPEKNGKFWVKKSVSGKIYDDFVTDAIRLFFFEGMIRKQ